MTETVIDLAAEIIRGLFRAVRAGAKVSELLDKPLREIVSSDALARVTEANERADAFVEGG